MASDEIRRAFQRAGRSSARADVDDELSFHLTRRIEALVAGGLSPEAARAEALRAFGDVDGVRRDLERLTRMRQGRARRSDWLRDVAQDVRYAARTMRRGWGFTLVALVTIALGVGATTATYSVVRGVLLRPLAYPTPDRIVRVWERGTRSDHVQFATPNLMDVRERSRTLSHLAGYLGGATIVLGADESVSADAYGVTRDFFGVFPVRPMLGRLFTPDEALEGGARVAVVSHDFWQRYLGGARDIERRSLAIYDQRYRVVGVMPAGFAYPAGADIWVAREFGVGESRTAHNWQAVGRLRPDATLDAARTELGGIMRGLAARYGTAMNTDGVTMTTLADALVGDVRKALTLIFGAVAFVLLVACVNLASANLARGEARRQEMAVRAALGAGRWRLARQLLAENLLLAGVGGMLALGVGAAFTRVLVWLAPASLPRLDDVRLDPMVAGFAILISMLTGVLIGVLPAVQVARSALRDAVSAGGRAAIGGDGGRSRRLLIAAELALVAMLLVGAGLTLRSFRALMSEDPGFQPASVLAVHVQTPVSRYGDSTKVIALYDRLLGEMRALPGARAVGFISHMPLDSWHINGGFEIAGRPERGQSYYTVVGGDYFRAMGIPLIRGRLFDKADRGGSGHVVVVNARAAAQTWPNQDPVGQRIRYTGMDVHQHEWMTVVGVVGDVRQIDLAARPQPETYVPYTQRPERAREGATLVVSFANDPLDLASAVRERIRDVDRDLPVSVSTLRAAIGVSVADRRFTMVVLAAFGGFALFLAAVGIYGVLAFSVSRRTREIGVRMALGAAQGRVLRMVLRDGMRAVVPGIALGLIGALMLGRVMSGLLYEIEPRDPVTFTSVIAVLLIVALAASFVPARRATRVDPMDAIRAQ